MAEIMDDTTIFNNRYQVMAKIGQGGLAEVYRAQDVALGRLVAVKALRREYVVDPAFLVRFHREAQSAAALTHPNVVGVYDFGQDQGRPYIVMEYVPGRDLRSLMNDTGVMPVAQVVDISQQVCAGVGFAHRSRLVHGDIKPGNVLITPDGRVKVTDFGLARALGESAMDEDGELVWGTPAYFSPEQAMGAEVVPATDVYAIGVIMYEMLTGRLPFVGTDAEVARKHIYEVPVPANKVNPRVPVALSRIVDRAMQKQADDRFVNADQMGQALSALRRQLETQTGGHPAIGAGQRPRAREDRFSGEAKPTTDWLAVSLGTVAVIAVLGLVPLWGSVMKAYVRPVPASAPTPTATLAVNQVRVPDVVGMETGDAKTVVKNAGLRFEVQGEAYHPTIPAFAIIEQSERAGMPVALDTTIGVVVSRGPEMVEVPSVSGGSLGSAQTALEEAGLISEVRQVWSEQAPGSVLGQDPPAGSLVQGRALVVLSVSSGTQVSAGTRLEDNVLLVAYNLPKLEFDPGDVIPLTLIWQASGPVKMDYTVFVHLIDEEGRLLAQHDGQPANGTRPTGGWDIGVQVNDPHELSIPGGLPPGEYQLWVGMYSQSGRLGIIDAGQLSASADAVLLTTIKIR